MPEVDPRVLLRASLDKILERDNLEENVTDCEKVIRDFSDVADRDLRFMKSRSDSPYLREQLDYDDLTTVGYYKLTRQIKKDKKIISFAKGNERISFWFKKGNVDTVNEVVESLVEKQYTPDEMLEVSTKAFAGIIRGDRTKNLNEHLLGENARSLKGYKLSYVTVSEQTPRILFGFTLPLLQITKTETVYQTK